MYDTILTSRLLPALALTLAAMVIATGCVTSLTREDSQSPGGRVGVLPGTPKADPNWTHEPRTEMIGPFVVRTIPGNITGYPGDVAQFTVEISSVEETKGRLQPKSWVRILEPEGMANFTGNTRVTGGVLIGPASQASFSIQYHPGGSWTESTISGPRVGLLPMLGDSEPEISLEAMRNGVKSKGLEVDRIGNTLTALFALGNSRLECDNQLLPIGNPTFLDTAERADRFVAFIRVVEGDRCIAQDTEVNPRIVVRASPIPPAETNVTFFVNRHGMIETAGWEAYSQSV